jgi:pimeloyl-ACP methyl ester carboxylesterase
LKKFFWFFFRRSHLAGAIKKRTAFFPLSCSLLAVVFLAAAAPPPVREIGPYRLALPGGANMPAFATADPAHPPAGITRVVLVLHGLNRNAASYFKAAREAQAMAGPAAANTLMLAPEVLSEEDAQVHNLPASDLRFAWNTWAEGGAAKGPTHPALFDVYDAILANLADSIPTLREIVIIGHSAGGQIGQRYAVVGNGPDALVKRSIAVRFVIANPSSYIWFSPDRPNPPAPGACPGFADWRYGLTGHLPPYVTGTPAALEARYVARDVTYLLGTRDINPNHPQLDKSCAGETQGATRFARGHAYFAALQAREGAALHHQLHEVPGVAHEGGRMITSGCGRAAMFGTPTCAETKAP